MQYVVVYEYQGHLSARVVVADGPADAASKGTVGVPVAIAEAAEGGYELIPVRIRPPVPADKYVVEFGRKVLGLGDGR